MYNIRLSYIHCLCEVTYLVKPECSWYMFKGAARFTSPFLFVVILEYVSLVLLLFVTSFLIYWFCIYVHLLVYFVFYLFLFYLFIFPFLFSFFFFFHFNLFILFYLFIFVVTIYYLDFSQKSFFVMKLVFSTWICLLSFVCLHLYSWIYTWIYLGSLEVSVYCIVCKSIMAGTDWKFLQ